MLNGKLTISYFLALSLGLHVLVLWPQSPGPMAPADSSAHHTAQVIALQLQAAENATRTPAATAAVSAVQPPRAPAPRFANPSHKPVRSRTASAPVTADVTPMPQPLREMRTQAPASLAVPESLAAPALTAKAATPVPAAHKTPSQALMPSLRERLQRSLQHQLQFHYHYPPLAIHNAWQGKVDLGIRVQANGALSEVRVLRSSGYSVLDSAALRSVHNITRIPEAETWLQGRYYDLVLPVIYRLQEHS